MKILMAASEIKPFSKTGGMGDVVCSLSTQLNELGQDVYLFSPLYKPARDFIRRKKIKLTKVGKLITKMSWREQHGEVFECKYNGLTYLFIDNFFYFGRNALYGYSDDNERFAYFCLAIKQALIEFKMHFDIIHIHDWQVGMLAALIKEDKSSFSKKEKLVLTIHNPSFQGEFDRYYLGNYYNLEDTIFDKKKINIDRTVSSLRVGIKYCDKVITVSPTHKQELLDDVYNFHLSEVLRSKGKDFIGILNGINSCEFCSESDLKISANYGYNNVNEGKLANKKLLLRSIKQRNINAPLYGLVSRLSDQKGIQILIPIIKEELDKGSLFALVGSGHEFYERQFELLQHEYPNQVFLFLGYNDDKARKVFASSDFFMMPSFFEPCGIGQMIAKRYAAIPLARRTGGLADSIKDYSNNKSRADGILFNDFDLDGLRYAFKVSKEIFEDKAILTKLRKNCLKADHSWNKSAKEYLKVYNSMVL